MKWERQGEPSVLSQDYVTLWLSFMCAESSEHHAKYHLIHYIGHLLLVGPDEQEMASMFDVLIS